MAGLRMSPGCNCCTTCMVSRTFVSRCGGLALLPGCLIEVVQGSTVVASGTTSGVGSSVTLSFDNSISSFARVSLAGHHTRTFPIPSSCVATGTIQVQTHPLQYQVSFHVRPCNVEGASIAITGATSATGTTDSGGNYTFTLDSISTSNTQSLSYAITPPGAHGMAVLGPVAFTVGACTPLTTLNVTMLPDATHGNQLNEGRYMPRVLSWSDQYGAAPITPSGPSWVGEYDYTSSQAIIAAFCDSGFEVPLFPLANQTATVTAFVVLAGGDHASELNGCGPNDYSAIRIIVIGCGDECGVGERANMPATFSSMFFLGELVSSASPSQTISAASGTFSGSFSIPTLIITDAVTHHSGYTICDGPCAETDAEVTVVGTI